MSAPRVKVAIIGLKGLPAYGGSARAGENMIAKLKGRYDFVVYNTGTHTKRASGHHDGYEQVVFKPLPIGKLNMVYYYARSMLSCLLRRDIDLVHVFHIDAAFVVPFLRLRHPVLAGHRARPQEFSKWGPLARAYFQLMEVLFYKLPADVLTSVSPYIKDRYQAWTRREILFIPNGVILEDLPEKRQRDGDEYVVVPCGRLMETKGVHTALEAMHLAKFQGRVVIVGNPDHDPGYSQRLRDIARGLRAEFTGLIQDKKELLGLLQGARVIVYPSLNEGMSNMLLEAGSTGVPIVCSDIPENLAVFEPDEAVFFEAGSTESLADRLTWTLSHADEARRIGERGERKVRSTFDWNELAERYDEVYQWLYRERRPLNTGMDLAPRSRGTAT